MADESADKMAATEVAKPAAPAGNARKKQDSALAKEMAKPAATAPAAAEPAGGWENFRAFASSNTRLPEAARDNNIGGTVRLLFAVGPDGKPADVQVLQALGYGCDEEAVRLVRLLEWSPVGAQAVVEVSFGR
jgi:periplasmic protein TonB